ncbi:hypothetical protein [Pseudoduganella chitinolytica]|uniref:Secreted protein n=1 Tax=Pseudoduganella chitinolytica TaxID=34070 RepID=A0ABY8BA24_9BURK|nr:hypothetical protein [Pseudoduganella chitinolytica]WEF32776.1 hypothetical protein PX653_25815 [Pseudoduganella chitinolytica]
MNSKSALALLLLMAGGLIYAATHNEHHASQWNGAREARGDGPRLTHASRRDDLAWLGPVQVLEQDELTRRMDRLLTSVMHDVATVQDPERFVCKQPAEVGPVPLLDAVDAWLDRFPDSRRDHQLTRNLYRAAAEGNWLARVQVYTILAERPARDNSTAYRTIQLMEWLQQHGIGALHGIVGTTLTGRHHFDGEAPTPDITASDMYAALHHSYPAQHKVGLALSHNDDPALAAVGRRMIDCAAGALPAYARMYGPPPLIAAVR